MSLLPCPRKLAGLALTGLVPLLLACINTVELPARPDQVPSALWTLPSAAHAAAVAKFQPPDFKQLDTLRLGYRRFVADFPRRSSAARDVHGRNDYAAALMYLGRAREAVGELQQTERIFPGHFATAANLGTAFELSGDVASARRWIEEGIRRNPEDHLGTEWLHLAILDAKLQLQDDPAWLESHSVLELVDDRVPAEIVRAIAYQMNERLNFITADDPIIADLFHQAGLCAEDDVVRDYCFDQSRRFGDLRAESIRQARRG